MSQDRKPPPTRICSQSDGLRFLDMCLYDDMAHKLNTVSFYPEDHGIDLAFKDDLEGVEYLRASLAIDI